MMNRFATASDCTAAPGLLWLGMAVALPLAACDTAILEVDEPTFATPASLQNREGLPVLYAGALGDFQMAYSGQGGAVDSYLSNSTNFSDEYHVADTFTTRNATDQRNQFPMVQGNTTDNAYARLQYARRSAAEVAEAVAEFSDDGAADPRYGTLKAIEGFAIVALGEGFCGAAPISTSRGGAPLELGEPLSTEQIFAEAVSRFDAALASNPIGAAAERALNLARIGKGRALLNNADFAGAAAAVANVPTTFTHFIEHSSNSVRQQNPLFVLQSNGRYSMSDREGSNGLPYRSAQDPRLPWIEDPSGGFDSSVRLFIDLRHPSFGADVLLASGIEARLIEAEADLRGGGQSWLIILNELRAAVRPLMTAIVENYTEVVPGPNNPSTTLAPLTDPGSEAARVDLLFQERAFWLFSTGHRHADMRRLVRQYGRPQNQVFPTGAHHRGDTYGDDVTFPLDFQETQNPHFTVDMCNVQQA